MLSVLTVGYDIPAKFQITGLSESENDKLAIISERTTSVDQILRTREQVGLAGVHLLISNCENVKPL